jgi:hypothetical protein
MVYAIIAVVVFILYWWMVETSKAAKDPDVVEASELGIPIWRYRKYKEAWDKIQAIYKAYGTQSEMSFKMADEIIENLPNMNEWRSFSSKQLNNDIANRMADIINEVNEIPEQEDANFKQLFDSIKENVKIEGNGRKILNEIIVSKQKTKEWEKYCMTRKNEIRAKFTIPCFIQVQLTEYDEKVKGYVKSFGWYNSWFYYEVEFERSVGFNNSFPTKIHYLTDSDIIDIVTKKKLGSSTHLYIKS